MGPSRYRSSAAVAAAMMIMSATVIASAGASGVVATSDLATLTIIGGPSAVSEPVSTRAGAIAEITPVRRSGTNRYATAVAVAEATFPQRVDTVYLATGDGFADALSASTALAGGRAALLLTASTRLPDDTAAALVRLAPSRVIAIGGPSAISDAVLNEVRAATPANVSRIAGGNRYETSARVAETAFPNGVARVYLATGQGFADALAASSALAATASVLLLTDPNSLPAAVANELDRLNPTAVFIIGGPEAVSDAVAAQVRTTTGVTPVRLAGSNRYDTARRVSEHASATRTPNVYLATGQGYADALSAAQAVIANRGTLLLTETEALPRATAEELARLAGTTLGPDPTSGVDPSITVRVTERQRGVVYFDVIDTSGRNLMANSPLPIATLNPRIIYVKAYYPIDGNATPETGTTNPLTIIGTYRDGREPEGCNLTPRDNAVVVCIGFPLMDRSAPVNDPFRDIPNHAVDISRVLDVILRDPSLVGGVDTADIGYRGGSMGAISGFYLIHPASFEPRITWMDLSVGFAPYWAPAFSDPDNWNRGPKILMRNTMDDDVIPYELARRTVNNARSANLTLITYFTGAHSVPPCDAANRYTEQWRRHVRGGPAPDPGVFSGSNCAALGVQPGGSTGDGAAGPLIPR